MVCLAANDALHPSHGFTFGSVSFAHALESFGARVDTWGGAVEDSEETLAGDDGGCFPMLETSVGRASSPVADRGQLASVGELGRNEHKEIGG